MAAIKDIGEPIVIVLLFILASVINRRSQRSPPDPIHSTEKLPLHRNEPWSKISVGGVRQSFSRFLAAFPFLIEIWYWNLTYWAYQLGRAYSAYIIHNDELSIDAAREHALQVLSVEKWLHLDIEHQFQSYILHNQAWLVPIFALVYYAHIIVGILFIIYMYTYIPASLFQRIRRTIAMDNLIAFIILTLWRCMPPRFIDGYDDVLHERTQSVWANNRFQLTIAAMPSLHFGTSAFLGWCVWRFGHRSHRLLRAIAPFYPMAMLATILATANHWVLDAMVGCLIPVVGWRYQWVLLYFLPLEKLFFHTLGVQKPIHTDPVTLT